jgi:hypothetical protein
MNHQTSSRPTGISEKLKETVLGLLDSATRLQKALVKRDVQSIWKILAEQEAGASQFEQYSYLWKHLISDGGIDNPDIRKANDEINGLLKRLRLKESSNAYLARSFLGAIRRSMRKWGAPKGKINNIYSSDGRMKQKQSSMLLNKVG